MSIFEYRGARITFDVGEDPGQKMHLDLSNDQFTTIYKALGLRLDPEEGAISMFTDETLRKDIIPKINLEEIETK